MRSPRLFVPLLFLILHPGARARELDFPPDAFDTVSHKGYCVDVTRGPYLCDKTGRQDCSAAIQQAIDNLSTGADKPRQQTLYFPNGTYLITRTLDEVRTDKTNACRMRIVGQSQAGTTIKRGDASPNFQNPAAPQGMIKTESISKLPPNTRTAGSAVNSTSTTPTPPPRR